MPANTPLFALHFDAGRDSNGNPQKLYVVFTKNGKILDIIDEGYEGTGALHQVYPGLAVGPTFDSSKRQYRELLRTGRSL